MRKIKDVFLIMFNEKILHKNFGDHEIVICSICNREIQPYWEPRYNGIRATCLTCGTNWQES